MPSSKCPSIPEPTDRIQRPGGDVSLFRDALPAGQACGRVPNALTARADGHEETEVKSL